MIHTEEWQLDLGGDFSVINLTNRIKNFVRSIKLKNGHVLVFYRHGTGALVITEHEAGLIADLEDMLENISSRDQFYYHHLRGVDSNAKAHLRSLIIGVHLMIPVVDGQLLLGTYQEALVIDMQTEKAKRKLVIQGVGE